MSKEEEYERKLSAVRSIGYQSSEGFSNEAISELDDFLQPYIDRISQLESELQTAIDEVNRLNVLLAGSCGNFAGGLG